MLEKLRLQLGLATLSVIAIILAAAILIGWQIGSVGFDYRILIIGLAMASSLVIMFNQRGYAIGYLMWIAMFFVGYRTVPLFEGFKLHPLILFIFLLIPANAAFRGEKLTHHPQSIGLPIGLILFACFALWGLLLAIINQRPIGLSLYIFANFFIAVPIFFVTIKTIERANNWKVVLSVFYTICSLVAALGCIEYFFPTLRQFAPTGLFQGDASFVADGGFVRANFSFWGSPIATQLSLIAFPLLVPLFRWTNKRSRQLILVIQLMIMLLGIYIGGYRSMWIYAVIGLSLCMASTGIVRSVVLAICVLPLLVFTPKEGTQRISSVVEFAQGTRIDGSMSERLVRYNYAIDVINQNPVGIGWSGSGWILNDFLQVGADAGIPAMLIFVIWFLFTVAQGTIVYFTSKRDPTLGALLICLTMCFGILMTDGVAYLPQNICPIWFVWALTYLRTRQVQLAVNSLVKSVDPLEIAPLKPATMLPKGQI
jgi:hypothetical protein